MSEHDGPHDLPGAVDDPASASPPALTGLSADLVGAIDAFDRHLSDRRAEIVEMRRLAIALLAEPAGGRTMAGIEPMNDDGRLLEALVARASTSDSMVLTLDSGPGLDEAQIRAGHRRMSEGSLVQRTIYPTSVLENASTLRWLHSWAQAGEHQRLLEAPPNEFAVFDREVAIVTREWGQVEHGYVVVRHPLLVGALCALFEACFALGQPTPIQTSGRGADQQLIELLSLGLKDEAVARHLGVSLRTTRRRVAELMLDLGAETRFQLGVAAAQAGLVAGGGRRAPR